MKSIESDSDPCMPLDCLAACNAHKKKNSNSNGINMGLTDDRLLASIYDAH